MPRRAAIRPAPAPRSAAPAISARPPSAPARSSSVAAASWSLDQTPREPPVQRRGQRQLESRIHVELVRQRRRAAGRAALAAQEMVHGGQLAPDPGGLPPGRLDGPLRLADRGRALLDTGLGSLALRTAPLDARAALGDRAGGRLALVFELAQLPGKLGLAVAVQRLQRSLEAAIRACAPRVGLVLGGRARSAAHDLARALKPRCPGPRPARTASARYPTARRRRCAVKTRRESSSRWALRAASASSAASRRGRPARARRSIARAPVAAWLRPALGAAASSARRRGARRGRAPSAPRAIGGRAARAARRPRPGA